MTIWQSPTPGQATLVGHVNQLLETHASAFTYNGAAIGTDPTLAATATALGATMLAQTFTVAAPINLGSVLLALGAIGAGQDVLVTLQDDSAGSPSGTPLVGCVVPPEWLPAGVAASASVYTVPLPYALVAGTYHIVLQPGSNLIGGVGAFTQALAGINDVQLTQSTATSGAQTQVSPGAAWTNESYGFGVYLRDTTGNLLLAIADDAISNLSFPCPTKLACYNYTSGMLSNVYAWVARDLYVTQNILCRDDASCEVGLGSAVNVTNSTVARSNTKSLDGSYSLRMTATALGNMIAQVGPYPVVAGTTYSWTAAFLAGGASLETALASVSWYDGATLLSTSSGVTVTTSESEWLASDGTAVAPATATLAFLEFEVQNAPASSIFYVDGDGLFVGPSSVWSYPGIGVASLRTINYVSGEMVSAT